VTAARTALAMKIKAARLKAEIFFFVDFALPASASSIVPTASLPVSATNACETPTSDSRSYFGGHGVAVAEVAIIAAAAAIGAHFSEEAEIAFLSPE